MKIEMSIIKEYKDGSADAKVRYDKEALEALVEEGIISLLTKAKNKERKPVAYRDELEFYTLEQYESFDKKLRKGLKPLYD